MVAHHHNKNKKNHCTAIILSLLGCNYSNITFADAQASGSLSPIFLERIETCAAMLEKYQFDGNCCSLQDNPANGNCILQISNGSCSLRDPCNSGCDPNCPEDGEELGCLVPSALYTSMSNETCPQSVYEAVNRTQPCCPELCPFFASESRFCDAVSDITEANSNNGANETNSTAEANDNNNKQNVVANETHSTDTEAGNNAAAGANETDSTAEDASDSTAEANNVASASPSIQFFFVWPFLVHQLMFLFM
jgi:hypothetical protein